MGDVLLRTAAPGVTEGSPPDAGAPSLQYITYRPAEAQFTPPASPQPRNPYAGKSGHGFHRSKPPMQLQMDTTSGPAYDRPTYNPSPSDSPTLAPTSIPSPKFPPRQRTPSLLRHAAVSSSLHEGSTMPLPASPTMAPTMSRQGSAPGSPGVRAFYNPLASNPVGSSGPAWDLEDSSPGPTSAYRPRGMTSSSQHSFHPNPPLRSVTSIPDYTQLDQRANLSGTYKPNRGVPNWSHNDYYPPPPRPFRGDEPRASFRSGWTNASSSLIETSGTERSSIATARSSLVSERQPSIYSRDQSRDRLRDDSPETVQTSEIAEEDDHLDPVGDVLDSYYYDEDDQDRSQDSTGQNHRQGQNPSPTPMDSELPGLSQTPSHDFDSLDSFQSSDSPRPWDDRTRAQLESSDDGITKTVDVYKDPLTIHLAPGSAYPSSTNLDDDTVGGDIERSEGHRVYIAPVQVSPFQAHYSPRTIDTVIKPVSQRESSGLNRSSEELPRRVSPSLKALGLVAPAASNRVMQAESSSLANKASSHPQMATIRKDISRLPQIPTNRSRLSRQDWAEIEAYSRQHSKKSSSSRTLSNDSNISRSGLHSPPPQRSEPLPELDEDEIIPRRASTSVYDRKSALFDLGMMASLSTSKSRPTDKPAKIVPIYNSTNTSPQPRKKAAPVERDRYGFKKASNNVSVQDHNAWSSKYEEHISRRRNKWIALMSKQGLSTTDPTRFPDMCEKVKRYARKGYPPEWRGAMWWVYSGGQHMLAQKENVGLYASLVTRVRHGELNKDDRDAIERDLDRTFPDNIHFRPEPATDLLDGESDDEPTLIQDLREVLSCFALNNPNIGYCQSLNFIAGLLLLFLKQDKERSFILLTIITQNHLPGAHARNLANTEVNVLMMLIKDYLPKVWVSINDTDLINSGAGSHAHPISKFQRQPTVALSCTSWFMSIFVGVLPIETVLRVWDAFLYEGPRALYRYALAIFKLGENEIRKFQPGDGELYMTVQNLPRRCLDPNILHDLAFVKKGFGNLSQNVIDQKRMFWRDQNKMAHQTSVKNTATRTRTLGLPRDEDDDGDSLRKAIGLNGLRRKASRRFRRNKG
ncbi:hypothetical protein ACN47E_005364 [Coniothyrium glycines]